MNALLFDSHVLLASAVTTEVVGIVLLAVVATWAADRLGIPSIILLLAGGLLAGPVFRVFDPDELFGDILPPLVALGVGLILFEGGLDLKVRELRDHSRVIWLLVTAGVLVTWLIGGFAAMLLLDLDARIAFLLGAILVVSGPTVIAPILRTVRPNRTIGAILKWESIAIDPVGAMLAVIVFEFVLAGADQRAGAVIADVALFIVAGALSGLVLAVPVTWILERHLVAERLVPLVGITAALVAFAIADQFASESGLLATTVLGFVLANRRSLRSESIIHFSGVVQTLVVGVLFVVLSSRLTRDQLSSIPLGAIALIVILVLVARPLAVWVSTLGSDLDNRQKALLAAVAPRGIVAAAVASVFALDLEEAGLTEAEVLAPVTFAVIVATVLLYGFSAGPVARRLGLAETSRQGALIIGAGGVEREIARALAAVGIPVVLASTNRRLESEARLAGHRTHYGNLAMTELPEDLDLAGVGRVLSVTPNDGANALVVRRHRHEFDPGEMYQIAPQSAGPGLSEESDPEGRVLFDEGVTYPVLEEALSNGQSIRQTSVTDVFTASDLAEQFGPSGRLMFVVRGQNLDVVTAPDQASAIGRLTTGDTALWIDLAPVEE